jgi:hypothetical protein
MARNDGRRSDHVGLAHSILGISLHLSGDPDRARAELEAAVGRDARARRTTTIYLGFEGRILAGAILARTLWMQGRPTEAAARARDTIKSAAEMDHSLTLCIALISGASVWREARRRRRSRPRRPKNCGGWAMITKRT